MVRTRCVRRVIAWAVAIGCVVLLAIAEQRYVTNFILGPFDLGPSDLESIGDISDAPRYFARVTGAKAIDTGIQHIKIHKRGGVETSREVSGAYYALLVGKKFLIVKSATGMPTTVEGELTAMRPDLDRELFNTPEMQANRIRFYPFYLSDDSFRLPGYLAIAGVLVFAFLLVKYGLPAWKHLQDPSSHPLMGRVVSWGDPIQLAVEVEREARSPHHKGAGWLVTDKYLVQSTFFTFDVLRFWDLLWAYKRVTRHSVNFIPTGKTYDGVLVCYGGAAEIKGREKLVDEVLAFAAARAPWAVLGFSDELQKLFSKNTQDFCVAVEQRRRDWAQQARSQTER
jgi:hypothetical protein